MTENNRQLKHYVWDMLARQPVPRPCLLPCVCPFGFDFEIGTDFIRSRPIRHALVTVEQINVYSLEIHSMHPDLPKGIQFSPSFWERQQMSNVKVHEFESSPIDVIRFGRCPICKQQEFGILTDDERLDSLGFDLYRRLVDAYSQCAMRKFVDSNWTSKRRRNRGKNHLDHMYSVAEGYRQQIAEHIIGSPVNLSWISQRENLVKSWRCSITADELFERYDRFAIESPNWLDIVHHVNEFGIFPN